MSRSAPVWHEVVTGGRRWRSSARSAADGQTNRDIAQALYVTPKTVEVHLSSACRKLGIRSRRGLAAALSTS
jgi:DNA-binding NarL/FixJ family response regulator